MTGNTNNRSQQLMAQLASAVQRNDPAALPKLLNLLKKAPLDPNLLHLTGLAYLNQKDANSAIDYFLRSLKSHRSQPELHNNLANAYQAVTRLPEAEKHYREALTLQPRFHNAWKNLGLLLINTKRSTESVEALLRALALQPKDVSVLTAIGNAYREQQLIDEAVEYYQRALNIDPNYINALHNLGLTYKAKEEPEQAIEFYRRARVLAPQLAEIDLSHGDALFDQAHYEQAEACYLNAVKKAPQLVAAHETLSEFYWQLGQHDQVEQSYRQAIQASPDHMALRLSLLKRLIACSRFESAKTLTEDSLQRQTSPELLHQQGKLFAVDLDYPSAQASFEKSLALKFDLNASQDLIKIHILQQDYASALQLLESSQKHHPDDQLNWALKGLCWRLMGDERYRWLIDYEQFVRVYTLPVPAGYSSLSEFLHALENVLLAMHSTRFAPSQQTLKQGTQTPGRLLHKKTPEIQLYKALLTDIVSEYIHTLPNDPSHPFLQRKQANFVFSGSWSVRLNNEGFHVNHVHPQGWISSACYIALPPQMSKSDSLHGCLKFGESGLGLGERECIERTVRPQAGQLVLFPSYTWHGTHGFEGGEGEYRLTAPFDVAPSAAN